MSATHIQSNDLDRQDSGVYFSDGLLDIFIGMGFLSAGAFIFIELVFLLGAFPAVLLPLWPVARKKTLARMSARMGGQVPGANHAKFRAVLLGALIAGVLSLMLGLGAFLGFESIPSSVFDWLRSYYEFLLGAILAGVFSLCGFVLGIRRCHLYAVLTFALFACGHFMGIVLPVYLLLLGGFITGIGFVILVRFLGEYPAR